MDIAEFKLIVESHNTEKDKANANDKEMSDVIETKIESIIHYKTITNSGKLCTNTDCVFGNYYLVLITSES